MWHKLCIVRLNTLSHQIALEEYLQQCIGVLCFRGSLSSSLLTNRLKIISLHPHYEFSRYLYVVISLFSTPCASYIWHVVTSICLRTWIYVGCGTFPDVWAMTPLFCHRFSRQKVTQSLVKADLIPGGAVVGCEYILKPVPLVCCRSIPAIPAVQPPFPRHPGRSPPTDWNRSGRTKEIKPLPTLSRQGSSPFRVGCLFPSHKGSRRDRQDSRPCCSVLYCCPCRRFGFHFSF